MAEKEQSFEAKLESAKTILENLSNPELSLEEGMKKYQEGIAILKEATKMLEEAKLTYTKLQEKEALS
ncbi:MULTISPECIES: exodeoxyribonuclease VII small subunit [Sulfurospirillum]|jgi:exodeoxyribonuclease VII small subunit|uniref:Exodeoxyribonuclease 7 small subunit n=3 Tax=Sulfurospirillum TaxID=57665 RepID=A0A1D7THI5_9BACT|nr:MULTISPECIES: exodeoxyribonuclease VII small subunit [Sulfurospirillum]AHJ11927.1 exodeoxyribonuclease 7 small subunit [Sulfurospirillum multivorans DSM 12446]AOO64436.1 exodeoxyribonuclease 7 small subunit [Sulfurospirillum halorespirans DSM 13726]QEH05432.1 exodeoxyribonuclease 7 small subunit [Sulfurospirillum multivorans]